MVCRSDANAERVRHEHRAPQQTWSFNGREAVSTAREGSLDARQEHDKRIQRHPTTGECRANERNNVPLGVKPSHLAADDLVGDVIGMGVEDRSNKREL